MNLPNLFTLYENTYIFRPKIRAQFCDCLWNCDSDLSVCPHSKTKTAETKTTELVTGIVHLSHQLVLGQKVKGQVQKVATRQRAAPCRSAVTPLNETAPHGRRQLCTIECKGFSWQLWLCWIWWILKRNSTNYNGKEAADIHSSYKVGNNTNQVGYKSRGTWTRDHHFSPKFHNYSGKSLPAGEIASSRIFSFLKFLTASGQEAPPVNFHFRMYILLVNQCCRWQGSKVKQWPSIAISSSTQYR